MALRQLEAEGRPLDSANPPRQRPSSACASFWPNYYEVARRHSELQRGLNSESPLFLFEIDVFWHQKNFIFIWGKYFLHRIAYFFGLILDYGGPEGPHNPKPAKKMGNPAQENIFPR